MVSACCAHDWAHKEECVGMGKVTELSYSDVCASSEQAARAPTTYHNSHL